MKPYFVLIADVKKSKKYTSDARGRLQGLLSASLDYLNILYSYGIEKRVVLSGGDEIQGLFRDPLTPFRYYRMLTFILGAKTIRGGIGFGDWSVRVEGESSPSQDGSAYHHARRALDEAKSNKPYDVVFVGDGRIDEYLTVLMDHSIGMSEMRTSAQNDTALIIEMMFPLVGASPNDEAFFGTDRVRDIERSLANLLDLRESMSRKSQAKPGLMQGITETARMIDSLTFHPVAIEPIGDAHRCPSFPNGKDIQGVSSILSNLTGMTRQGIDRQLASSRVVQERNAVVAYAYSLKLSIEW